MKKIILLLPVILMLFAGCAGKKDKKAPADKGLKKSTEYQSKLFIDLPEGYNTPDGLAMAPNGDLILSVPNFNNQHLLEKGMIDEPSSPFMARIDKKNNIEHWYDFKEEDFHPETGKMGPMDAAFAPDGNLYVADMQVFHSRDHKSRLVRINVEDGKAVDMDVVVTGFIASNGLFWEDSTLFVTESVMASAEDSLASGVYAFTLEELSAEKPVELLPYQGKKFDNHLVVSFSSDNSMGFGADGVTFDDEGFLYTTVIEKGVIYKSTMSNNNKAVETVLFAENPDIKAPDGLIFDEERQLFFVADFLNNAVHAIDKEGNVNTLQKNGDLTGANGGLDQPAEVILRNNQLIIVNMDMAWASEGLSVNTKVDGDYNLAVIELE